MVTKTEEKEKETKEEEGSEEEHEQEEEETPDKIDIGEIVDKVVEKIQDKFKLGGKTTEEKTPAKRASYRDQEEEMNELVTSKVQELLKLEKESGENHETKKTEAKTEEKAPGTTPRRRIERIMGW